jgi:AcrR family transcriptional regulator
MEAFLTQLFDRIPEGKRRALLTAALEEFANRGYGDASTNAIVKRLGIAKGSLFKYFATKEELLAAVFRHASEQIGSVVGSRVAELPDDIGPRVRALAAMELELLAEAPLYYRFFTRVFADEYDPVVRELREREHAGSVRFFRALMDKATLPEGYPAAEREHVIDVLEWTLTGLGKRWFVGTDEAADPSDPAWRDAYLAEVDAFVELILHGGTHE